MPTDRMFFFCRVWTYFTFLSWLKDQSHIIWSHEFMKVHSLYLPSYALLFRNTSIIVNCKVTIVGYISNSWISEIRLYFFCYNQTFISFSCHPNIYFIFQYFICAKNKGQAVGLNTAKSLNTRALCKSAHCGRG